IMAGGGGLSYTHISSQLLQVRRRGIRAGMHRHLFIPKGRTHSPVVSCPGRGLAGHTCYLLRQGLVEIIDAPDQPPFAVAPGAEVFDVRDEWTVERGLWQFRRDLAMPEECTASHAAPSPRWSAIKVILVT